MISLRIPPGLAVLLACLMPSLAMAQNPKPPTPLAWSADRLPVPDNVVLWANETNLTVYIDSTSNPDDQNMLSKLEIKWTGEGGFNEAGCDFDTVFTGDLDVCTAAQITKASTGGFGPVYSFGEIIPEGFPGPAALDNWIVDGLYLTGGTLDKFTSESPWLFDPFFPEPSSLVLLAIGALGLIAARRRR